MLRARLILLALLAVASYGGCTNTSSFMSATPSYYPTAEQNYVYGEKELKAGSWQTAVAYFQHVRDTFGFSRWATLSELGIADANLGREKFAEAIDGYKAFIKAHPSHEHVQDGYAAYKIGEAYYKQIPTDWFLAPPSYEKDQGPVMDAMRELSAFADQYGDSVYAPKARKMIGDCVQRLTDHELYVARFYLDRDKPYAAIGRLEGVLRDYPGARREPETLLLLGRTYLKMDKPDRAREVFTKLSSDHPEDYRAGKAKLYIRFIDRKFGSK
ncbi:MAG TPA: outer membrane protein assembly factor BamD [Polyangia bacterium]